MNKKMFSEAVKKGIAAAKEKLREAEKKAQDKVEAEIEGEPEEGTIASVIEVLSPKSNTISWIVRRAAPPQGYNPKQHAMIVMEDLESGRIENVTLYLYDMVHSYHTSGKPKYYYLQFHNIIPIGQIPQYVRDALDELAATLADTRLKEKPPRVRARPTY